MFWAVIAQVWARDKLLVSETLTVPVYRFPAVVTLRDDIARAPRPDLATLYYDVGAVVDRLKAAGWPAERVIVAVKQIAEDGGLKPSAAMLSASKPVTNGDVLIIRMIEWCIERYYRRDN
jgi:hypothetical protein